jgi:hypothetical protein
VLAALCQGQGPQDPLHRRLGRKGADPGDPKEGNISMYATNTNPSSSVIQPTVLTLAYIKYPESHGKYAEKQCVRKVAVHLGYSR